MRTTTELPCAHRRNKPQPDRAVQAYVDGFDSELHLKGYLGGVYANPAPINTDISSTSTPPDDIWIAKTPAGKNPPQVTIWNQGINDTLWPITQRIHQFLIDQPSVTWGGTALKIDEDIDNAAVSNANAVAKTYSYKAPTVIDCPGANETVPLGINDMNQGAFISGPGQMGTVVGYYRVALGSSFVGFQNTGGSCSPINIQGSNFVEATGINNLGQIVGYFEDSKAVYHGFLLNPGKTPIQIDYAGATATYLYGINDAGQIVGWAYSPNTFYYQTFMYYGGQFFPLGFTSNFEYTQGYGISGNATITGAYYYEPISEDFELSATPSGTPPTWGGTVIAMAPGGTANTLARGINANNELAGFYYSSSCMNTVYQCGFMWSGALLLNILQYGTDANVAEGINDFAQVVGPYTDSTTLYSHGLLWTHQ